MMLPRRNPMACSVPISRVRLARSECLVIMAPITAPMEKMTDSVMPRMLINRASAADWSAKNWVSPFASTVRRWSSSVGDRNLPLGPRDASARCPPRRTPGRPSGRLLGS
jgi:hypothetical protein